MILSGIANSRLLDFRNPVRILFFKRVNRSVSLQHRFQLFLRVEPRHLALFETGIWSSPGLQAVGQLKPCGSGHTGRHIAELSTIASVVLSFSISFRGRVSLYAAVALGAKLRFTTLLVFTRLRAVGVVFAGLFRLVFLLLRPSATPLVVFQIAVERFNFCRSALNTDRPWWSGSGDGRARPPPARLRTQSALRSAPMTACRDPDGWSVHRAAAGSGAARRSAPAPGGLFYRRRSARCFQSPYRPRKPKPPR